MCQLFIIIIFHIGLYNRTFEKIKKKLENFIFECFIDYVTNRSVFCFFFSQIYLLLLFLIDKWIIIFKNMFIFWLNYKFLLLIYKLKLNILWNWNKIIILYLNVIIINKNLFLQKKKSIYQLVKCWMVSRERLTSSAC